MNGNWNPHTAIMVKAMDLALNCKSEMIAFYHSNWFICFLFLERSLLRQFSWILAYDVSYLNRPNILLTLWLKGTCHNGVFHGSCSSGKWTIFRLVLMFKPECQNYNRPMNIRCIFLVVEVEILTKVTNAKCWTPKPNLCWLMCNLILLIVL